MRVFRVAVPTIDIAAARPFYETVLDMSADDTVPSRIYFHCDDVIVAIIDWTVEGRGEFSPTIEDLYFSVTDLEAAFVRARAAGARITSPIEQRSWGERSFYCLDLDGNHLCFVDETTLFLGRGAAWS
ncbi:MAG TPA: VOC family protein [Acidimicrobiales bacterium]